MPTWVITILSLAAATFISYLGWLGVQVVRLGRDYAKLCQRVESQEKRCERREAVIVAMDVKLDTHGEQLTRIVTLMEAGAAGPRIHT